jgi:UDP-N-acetylmuramate dehydrogenase
MFSLDEIASHLASIPDLQITRNELMAAHTRFAIGGPASVFASTESEEAFIAAAGFLASGGVPWLVIGLGTNLIVADAGYPGAVLQYRAAEIREDACHVHVQAGAPLQTLVDFAISRGLKGLENMTGIPGLVGAAIYGNAGAYGSSTSDFVRVVRYFDGQTIHQADHAACEFRYRSSAFKHRREWLILSAELEFDSGDAAALRARADEILTKRNAKYPPDLRCAGSIFKNLILAELPASVRAQVPAGVVKGGKVPAAWFLEAAGAKGMCLGDIHVADYHANLIYNAGTGAARQLVEVIGELKRRVRDRFGFDLEEEVQLVGFDDSH